MEFSAESIQMKHQVSNMNSPGSGRRENTFNYPSGNESFAFSEWIQYPPKETGSARLISLIHKYQHHTELWVVNKACKKSPTKSAEPKWKT